MNRTELILKLYIGPPSCRHLESKICQTARPLSPSRLPLRAHRERRLGTRQARYITFQLALEKEGKGAVWSGQAQTDRLKLLSSGVLNLTTIKVIEVIH